MYWDGNEYPDHRIYRQGSQAHPEQYFDLSAGLFQDFQQGIPLLRGGILESE